MDLERAASIIKALPLMSKTIVDDTIYEKVLSYLTLVLNSHSPQEIEQLDRTCDIYQRIHEACQHQDYRVMALCIRLLGQLVLSQGFRSLRDYPDLLGLIHLGIRSSEAALRCACIEACCSFVCDPDGQQWFADHPDASSFILYTLLDDSQYVVAQTSQLLVTAISRRLDLLTLWDPTNLIRSILSSHQHHQVLSALDFCWTAVKEGDSACFEFIRSKQLIHPIFPLLSTSNRMIRIRVLEIVTAVLQWDHQPRLTLGLTEQEEDLSVAYSQLSQMAIESIETSDRVDQLTTSISLLEATFQLLKRIDPVNIRPAYDKLYQQMNGCLSHTLPWIKSDRTRNTVIQTTLRAIHTLLRVQRSIIQIPNYSSLFDVLLHTTIYTDTRVLKETISLLTDTLIGMEDETLLHSSIESLVAIMTEENELDCKALAILFSSIHVLLGDNALGVVLVASGKALAEAICLKLIDTQWDVRDMAVQFVGQLFAEPSPYRLQFGLVFDLPLSVFERIHDAEPYVRASAIEVLKQMMTTGESWAYIQQHQVSKNLATKLPQFLHDTEAFVKRAALDAIDCLVSHRACQGMVMELASSPNSLNPDIIKRLASDDDTEVRVRTCRLLKSLRLLYLYEVQQNKKGAKATDFIFFQHLEPAELLMEAVTDTSRVVRIEAVRVIESILAEEEDYQKGSKRVYADEPSAFDTQFLTRLRQVDLDRQRQTLDPEHLYEEAFDINADMMTSSIIPKDPEDDINMLDCY